MFLSIPTSVLAFSHPGNWVEVARFEGSGSKLGLFTCDYPEWRVSYEYTPSRDAMYLPDLFAFSVTVYPQGDDGNYVLQIGKDYRGGTLYVPDNVGDFNIRINTRFVVSYTIIVEQNIDSIPEFPSWTILSLLLTGTLVSLLIKKKIDDSNS